jgi:hypothetical protein
VLRRALARLEADFIVTDAARYLPFDYAAPLADLRAHPEALGTLSVSRSTGAVALDGDQVATYGEAGAPYASYGAIALRRSPLESVEDGAVWGLEALLRRLAKQRKLRAFVAPDPGYDAASLELAQHLARLPSEP